MPPCPRTPKWWVLHGLNGAEVGIWRSPPNTAAYWPPFDLSAGTLPPQQWPSSCSGGEDHRVARLVARRVRHLGAGQPLENEYLRPPSGSADHAFGDEPLAEGLVDRIAMGPRRCDRPGGFALRPRQGEPAPVYGAPSVSAARNSRRLRGVVGPSAIPECRARQRYRGSLRGASVTPNWAANTLRPGKGSVGPCWSARAEVVNGRSVQRSAACARQSPRPAGLLHGLTERLPGQPCARSWRGT